MIKTVIFDMGGVIITLDESEAGKRFIELGMKEFAEKMDPYKQVGLNGQLEEGKISEEEYRREVVSHRLRRCRRKTMLYKISDAGRNALFEQPSLRRCRQSSVFAGLVQLRRAERYYQAKQYP